MYENKKLYLWIAYFVGVLLVFVKIFFRDVSFENLFLMFLITTLSISCSVKEGVIEAVIEKLLGSKHFETNIKIFVKYFTAAMLATYVTSLMMIATVYQAKADTPVEAITTISFIFFASVIIAYLKYLQIKKGN